MRSSTSRAQRSTTKQSRKSGRSSVTKAKANHRSKRKRGCVSKKTFDAWEGKIRELYSYPSPGYPALMRRNKVIVVVDFIDADGKSMHNRVAERDADLPAKHTLQMYHIGRERSDGVSLGREMRKGKVVFKHPALDFGGLTNVNQSAGERLAFADTGASPIRLTETSKASELCKRMHTAWLKHSEKQRFAGEPHLKQKCRKWVQSVIDLLSSPSAEYKKAHLRFFRLPPQTRMIVATEDIQTNLGNFYLRQFSTNDKGAWACHSPAEGMFLGISDNGRITPNLNLYNIRNEYQPV